MNPKLPLCVLLSMIPSLVVGQADPDADVLEELHFSDPNWAFPAYFTPAPRQLAIEMRNAVEATCERLTSEAAKEYSIPPGANARHYVNVPGRVSWFCQRGDVFFYRGIDGWGKESRSGFVCANELGLPGQKYFGDSRFGACVFIWWNTEAGTHEIEFDEEE